MQMKASRSLIRIYQVMLGIINKNARGQFISKSNVVDTNRRIAAKYYTRPSSNVYVLTNKLEPRWFGSKPRWKRESGTRLIPNDWYDGD
jgi:hypothetical protein